MQSNGEDVEANTEELLAVCLLNFIFSFCSNQYSRYRCIIYKGGKIYISAFLIWHDISGIWMGAVFLQSACPLWPLLRIRQQCDFSGLLCASCLSAASFHNCSTYKSELRHLTVVCKWQPRLTTSGL